MKGQWGFLIGGGGKKNRLSDHKLRIRGEGCSGRRVGKRSKTEQLKKKKEGRKLESSMFTSIGRVQLQKLGVRTFFQERKRDKNGIRPERKGQLFQRREQIFTKSGKFFKIKVDGGEFEEERKRGIRDLWGAKSQKGNTNLEYHPKSSKLRDILSWGGGRKGYAME